MGENDERNFEEIRRKKEEITRRAEGLPRCSICGLSIWPSEAMDADGNHEMCSNPPF